MNYTDHTHELTASLQELTARGQKQHDGPVSLIPKTVSDGELVLSDEVASFLERRESYAVKTRKISEGVY